MNAFPDYITQSKLKHFIEEALDEDIGNGDHSTLATIPKNLFHQAQLIVKEDCIIAGIELAEFILHHVDKNFIIKKFKFDGEFSKKGDIAFAISGKVHSILSTERLILNCMQRMSGIATFSHQMIKKIQGTGCVLLDTRKTTPNFRMIEKWAVKIGGASNHRFGLYDMIILKDNHIDYNRSLSDLIKMTTAYLKKNHLNLRIEVETRNLDEVREVLKIGNVHRIMLDNMKVEMIIEALKIIDGKCEVEASGEINENNIKSIAETGVNFISMGALIHSAKNIDISLKAVKKNEKNNCNYDNENYRLGV